MCVLRVTGRRFDPESYLRTSTLRPYRVFRAGDPRRGSRSAPVHDASGFLVEVGGSAEGDLPNAAAAAIEFLREHRDSLAALGSIPEVEDMRLDFAVDLRIDRQHVFTQFEHFPAELVSLAGAVGFGLELSIYPTDLERLAARVRARRRRDASRKD
jgi:hypothetical protein